jgi:putative nucleotidyltransferase with HDIG domain
MPVTAQKMLRLLDKPDATPAQIGAILRHDPGLTANILKLTNSSFFGLPTKVSSVKQAVVLLGWKKLTQLVMASCVNTIVDKPVAGYDLPPGELWKHSIAVSVAAEGLVRELRLPAAEEIFTAGLLHDVGKLVLGRFVKDDIERIEAAASAGLPFELAEQSVLGTDHAEIGAEILKNWAFPQDLVSAVRWHHNPDSADETNILVDIIHVANALCLMIGIGIGREGLQHEPSTSAIERVGIKASNLEVVASYTLQWVSEFFDILK